jgi:hypothetical protein
MPLHATPVTLPKFSAHLLLTYEMVAQMALQLVFPQKAQ